MNTAAILALAYKGELKIDYAIFADTGCEYPDTYRWIEEVAKPIFKHLEIEFVTIIPQVEGTNNLYDYCWKWRIIPLRQYRICTAKFKLRPIHKWIKENTNLDVEVLLGIDAGEKHRAKPGQKFLTIYPLIEHGYDRKACKRLIKSVGWPVPPKSGCYICPFSRIGQWKKLYEFHPELFAKAEALEKNTRKFPNGGLLCSREKPLGEIRKKIGDSKQQGLGVFLGPEFERDGFDRGCVMCHV